MVFFKNKFFRQHLLINWVSLLGNSLYYLAIMTYVTRSDYPELGVLIMTASEMADSFFQMILGAMADSVKHKIKRLIQSGLFRGMAYLAIGVVMLTTDSLWGLIAIGILNMFSDLFGTFANLIKYPFLKFMVKEDELEGAMGINGAVMDSILSLAGFLGVVLLALVGIHTLAFLNAFIFFGCAIAIKFLERSYREVEAQITPSESKGFLDLLRHIKASASLVVAIKELRNFFLLAGAMNALLSLAVPIFVLFLALYPEMSLVNMAFSLALLKGLMFGVGILGGLLGPKYFQWMSTSLAFKLTIIGHLVFIVGMLSGFLWTGIGLMLIGTFMGTIFNLRFNTLIMKQVPAEMMGTVWASFDVFLMAIPALISMALVALAGISIQLYGLVGLIAGILLLVILFKVDINRVDFGKLKPKT